MLLAAGLRGAAAALRARLPAARRPQDLEVARERPRPARPRSTSTAPTRSASGARGRCRSGRTAAARSTASASATSASSATTSATSSRATTAMIARYRDGDLAAVPTSDSPSRRDARAAGRRRRGAARPLRPHGRARERSGRSCARSTGTSRRRAPWQLAKDEARAAELDRVLYDLADGLRVVAVALAAVPARDVGRGSSRRSASRPTSPGSDVAYGARQAARGHRAGGAALPARRRSPRPRRDRHARAPRRVRRGAGALRRARARGRRRRGSSRSAPGSTRAGARSRSPSAHDGVYAALGIDPHQAATPRRERVDELRELLAHPKAVAVGETGLDYYRGYATPRRAAARSSRRSSRSPTSSARRS